MNVLVILAGLAGFCLVMWDFCQRLPPEQSPLLRRWFKGWMLKGLLTPFLLWMIFDSAAWNWLPPLMPAVQFAKMNGDWPEIMEYVVTLGLFVISTYWAAVTVAWLLVVLSRQTAHPRQWRNCFLFWSAILGPLAALLTWSFGWRFAGLGATLWLLPILQQVLALQPEQKPAPIYSRAIAAIHLDKYEEAEQAVIKELESCEDDFEGWLMLAELYANQFHDLPAAQELLRQTCEHPGTTPSQFAVAHHRLADWQLKLAQDPDAARAALEEICRRHPRSHLDRMARLRILQMPASREEWIARQGVKKIRLHTLGGLTRDFGAAPSARMSRHAAFARSQQCVQRLQSNPDDIAAREELARLWAEDLDQVEMGVEQMDLLLAMPGVAPAKAAEWLGLVASWHLRFPQDLSAARTALERLIRHYPQSPQTFAAQRRLNLLDLESKMRQAAATRQERHS
jgi:tetratricopeptide (TPR) repeat protein